MEALDLIKFVKSQVGNKNTNTNDPVKVYLDSLFFKTYVLKLICYCKLQLIFHIARCKNTKNCILHKCSVGNNTEKNRVFLVHTVCIPMNFVVHNILVFI